MKKIVLGLAVGLVLAMAPACSSTDDPAPADSADLVQVRVSSNQFDPPSVKIKVGQSVRWTWAGGSHNVVSGSSCTRDDAFVGSGAPQSGGTYERKFEKAGKFPYFCEPHCSMGMKGEVVVE